MAMASLPHFLFCVIFAFTPRVWASPEIKRVSFGETCGGNTSIRCDSRESLTCGTNQTCVCLKEKEMVYDKNRGKCVVLSGERCSYTAVETDANNYDRRWTETLSCVDNAICTADGFCRCTEHHYENSEGFCVTKGHHGWHCRNDLACRTDEYLTCKDNRCSCIESEAKFSEEKYKCVAKAGVQCKKYGGGCVKNSRCREHNYLFSPKEFSGPCECTNGYIKSQDGLCLGNHGSSCQPQSAPCMDALVCNDGVCQCPYPQIQKFNGYQCTSSVYGPCLEGKFDGNVKKFQCQEHAECRNDNGIFECLCKKGYIYSKDAQCRRIHGSQCLRSNDCDGMEGSMLSCINGICTCPDFQIYDESKEKCRGLVGAVCNLDNLQGEGFCIDGAHCEEKRWYQNWKTGGICRCVPPNKVDVDRKCKSKPEVFIDSPDSGQVEGYLTRKDE